MCCGPTEEMGETLKEMDAVYSGTKTKKTKTDRSISISISISSKCLVMVCGCISTLTIGHLQFSDSCINAEKREILTKCCRHDKVRVRVRMLDWPACSP